MSIRDFLNKLQQNALRLRTSVQKSQQGRLRVMNLEDRRLLDATAGFLAGQLLLDGFDASESLSISEDVGGHLDFDLSSGKWGSISGTGLSLLNADQTLRIDSANVSDIQSLDINAGNANLSGITAATALNLNQLQIQNGGHVQLDDLTVAADTSITATSIVDSIGSQISISGSASFEADSITLGDNVTDITNFGSLTFVSTGDVSISEDSATDIAGANSAATLTLTSAADITNASASILNVSGAASIEGTSIQLDDAGASETNFGSVTLTSVGDVTLDEASNLDLTGSSTGANVSLSASGDIGSSAGAMIAADSLTLTAMESLTSEGTIGSSVRNFAFDADVLTTSSDGDQYLAADGATEFSTLRAVDSSNLFDAGTTATVFLNDGEFTGSGTGVTGGLAVADLVELSTDATIVDVQLSATSEVAFRLESTAGVGGAILGNFDQWQVSDSVSLGGASLTIVDQNLLADATTIRLIDNTGSVISGTFSGLAEGDTVTGTSGQRYQISYVGGDGNDVELTALTSTFAFASTTDTVVEDVVGGAKTITVNRTGDLSAAESLTINVAGGTAGLGTDVGGATTLTASFAAGAASTTVSVVIIDDAVVEADESLTLTLVNPDDGFLDASASVTALTVINDDVTTVRFQLASASVTEGDSGTTTVTYQVSSSNAVDGGFAIGVSSQDMQAVVGTDYLLQTSSLTFTGSANEIQLVTVDVSGETLFEANESFLLELGSVTAGNALIDVGSAFSIGGDLQIEVTNDDTESLVILDSGRLTLSDETLAGQDNSWSIFFDDTTNELVVTSDQTNLGTGSAVDSSELRFDAALITQEIIIDGRGGDDVLTIDFRNGSPLAGTGLSFTGGSESGNGSGDGLSVIGDGLLNATYTPDVANFGAGQIAVGGKVIQFTGLEPIDVSGFATATLTLPGAADVLTIQDGADFFAGGGEDALRVSGTSGGVAIETAAFWNNDNLLIDTVASGVDGIDQITINSSAGDHSNTNVTINTGSTAGDQILINGAIDVAGDLNLTSTTTRIDTASVSAGGDLTFTGSVLIDQSLTIVGDTVSLTGTLDSTAGENNSVTITGNAVQNGNIGSADALTALSISGTTNLNGNVSTTGHQSYGEAFTLTGDAVLTSTASGSIQFQSTVDGAANLIVNTSGTTGFTGAVGATTALTSLTTDAGGTTTISGGQVSTTGVQTFQDAVDLTMDTVLNASTVSLTGGLDGDHNDLTINGNLNLQSNIGDVVKLDVTGASVLDGDVVTTGRQDFRDSVTMIGDSSLTANGLRFHDTVDGNQFLTAIGGATGVQFDGAVGNTTALSGLNVSADTVQFDGSVQVDDQGLTVTSVSTTSFAANVASTNNGSVTLSNGGELTFADGTTFQLDAAFHQSGAGLVTSGANILTTGDSITFASAITQSAAVALRTTASGNAAGANISLQNVNSAGFNLNLDAGTSGTITTHAVSTVGQLTVEQSASTTFTSVVTATTISLIDTVDSVTFQDNVSTTNLLTTGQGYSVHLLEDSTVMNAVSFGNTGGVTLGDATNDVQRFNGGLTSLTSVNSIQGEIQTSSDNLALGQTTLVDSTLLNTGAAAGDISVGQISGNGIALTGNAGTGAVEFSNAANVIGDLTVTAGEAIIVEADNVTQGAAWTIANDVMVSATGHDILLNNVANGFGNVTLTANNVQLSEAGATTIESIVATNMVQLTSTAAINDASVDTTTDITAASVVVNAAAGIGNIAAIEVQTPLISAVTTTGAIDLTNSEATATTVQTLTTTTGDIDYVQSGSGDVAFQTVANSTGKITLSALVSNLTINGNVVAADGDIEVSTVSGNVVLEGVINAGDQTITITSGDSIEGDSVDTAADVVADRLLLDAVNGIGVVSPLETSVNELAVTTAGAGVVRLVNSMSLELLGSTLFDDLELCTTIGDINVSGVLNAIGQSVVLQSDTGQVTETGAGTIVADELGVNAAAGINLNQAANNVASFAATTAAGSIRFTEADGFQVTSLAATGCFDGAIGVTSFATGTIELTSATGDLTVNEAVRSQAGDLQIEASSGTVLVNRDVVSDTANIGIRGRSVQQIAAVATGGAGSVSVMASSGDLTMLAAATTATDSGSMTITATGDVQLASLVSSTGDLSITADSDANSVGSITDSNAAAANLTTAGVTALSAATGIDVDTNLPSITAIVTATGDVWISEADSLTLTNVTTANGSIVISANGPLIATSVLAGGDSADSIDLSTTSGGISAASVSASGLVSLAADVGDVQVVNVASAMNGITVTADSGSIQLQSAVANASGAVIALTASADIVDTNGAALNVSATAGTATLSAANIGSAGNNVFKPTAAVPVQIDATRLNLTATGADPFGIIAVELATNSVIDTLSGNHVYLQSAADVHLAATPVANSLSIIAAGNIELPASVTVADDLRLEAQQITSVPGPTIDLNATRILFVSGSSANLSITASEFDGKTDGDLHVSSDSALLQLTDLNCDLTAIHTNGATNTLNQTTGGRIAQQLPADAIQNSRVVSTELLLTGTGTFELTNGTNNIGTLAASTTGSVAYADVDSITIGIVNAVLGISTSNQDLLIDAGDSLEIQQQVNVGTQDVRLTVGSAGTSGNIVQNALGSITANELGVRNEAAVGDLVLSAGNDVNTFAAVNTAAGGSISFQDINEVTIATVSAATIPDAAFTETIGVTTNNGDVMIATGAPALGANSLLLDAATIAGDGTVRLLVNGTLNQNSAGIIQAEQLGVRQVGAVGDVILDDANSVIRLAIDNAAAGGTIGFQNQQTLTIGVISASTTAAAPDSAAVQFDETSGLSTSDGIIQLNVDGPASGDGEIRIHSGVTAGNASVAMTSDGSISQSATASITAANLLVRQQAEVGGINVDLGTAGNDVSNVAIRNLSDGGDILLTDVSELTIANVSVADVGRLSITAFAGVDSDAGDINITSSLDQNVEEDINAASDTSTASIDETITLISRSGNFTLADGTVISTDENPNPGFFDDVTADRIHILAGTDGSAGIVDLGDPSTIEVRTDGGVAKQIAPRPSGFTTAPTTGAESAFVTLTDAENSRRNLTFQSDGFLGELDFIFGVAGEENLEVVVDWGVVTLVDLSANGVAGAATQQPSGEFVFDQSDRDKSIFFIDDGGQRYQISHIYQPGDLITTTNDRNGRQFNPNIIGVRFSVAQHESINIWGTGAVDPTSTTTISTAAAFTGTTPSVTDAAGNSVAPTSVGLSLLSSTDTNGLRNLQAEASNDFPLLNQAVTPTGKPVGLAEWEFIAGPSPGIVLFQPTERFVADLPQVTPPADAEVISEISGDAFFGDGAASDAGVGTDVYLQIRRYFELDADAEVVIARINDSELITSREAFEEFVAENPELQDGAGYEVWLVTETGGQRVERPVVQFEITGGRPGPATETMLDSNQPARLIDVEFQQADDFEKHQKSIQRHGGGEDEATSGDDGDNKQPLMPKKDSQTSLEERQPEGKVQGNSGDPQSSVSQDSEAVERLQPIRTSVQAEWTRPIDDSDSAPDNVTPGVAASTAVSGITASAYGAISRFRARQNTTRDSQSLTSRTMRLLRDNSELPNQHSREDP